MTAEEALEVVDHALRNKKAKREDHIKYTEAIEALGRLLVKDDEKDRQLEDMIE